jgi:hypothetical protein
MQLIYHPPKNPQAAICSTEAIQAKDLGKPIYSPTSIPFGCPQTPRRLSHVPVRKPNRHEFFRVRPEPEYWLDTGVFEDREERETFFVAPRMRDALLGEIKPVLLVPAITRQRVLFLWPIKLPTEGQRFSGWTETAREAAELAKTRWVRLVADMGLGGYRIYHAQGELSEPEWPDKNLQELLQIAFRDRVVDTDSHPVVRRLRGLA